MGTLEPVAVINTGVSIVEISIALMLGFGLDFTAEQVAVLMVLTIAVGNIVRTRWCRREVTPLANPRDIDGRPLTPSIWEDPVSRQAKYFGYRELEQSWR